MEGSKPRQQKTAKAQSPTLAVHRLVCFEIDCIPGLVALSLTENEGRRRVDGSDWHIGLLTGSRKLYEHVAKIQNASTT